MVSSEKKTERGVYYGYIIVGASFIIMMTSWGIYYSFGTFFKPMLEDFRWTRAMTSGAFSLAAIVEGAACIAVGGLTDRYGPRTVLTVSGIFLGLSYLLMSQVSTLWQLYVFYGVFMGIAMSGPFNSLVPTIARWFFKRRGFMTGLITSGIGLGAVVVPPIATALIEYHGWRPTYLIIGALALVVVVGSAQFLKLDPSQKRLRPYGAYVAEGAQTGGPVEGMPMREVIRTNPFWIYLAMMLCYGFGLFVVMVHIVPHATDLGIEPAAAATVLSAIGASSIFGKMVMGHVADSIGGRNAFLIGFLGMLVAFVWLQYSTSLWMLYVFGVIFGLAYSGCVAPQSPLVADLYGLRCLGLILGIGSFLFTIGGSIGPLFAGHLFDITGSYQTAFWICAVLMLVGAILTWMIRFGTLPSGMKEN